jgi:type I restriction enzyme M protein
MADNRREQERNELYRTIWALANDLRGSVDGWDFKQYVLGMLFYRYISENLTTYLNKGEWEAGNTDLIMLKLVILKPKMLELIWWKQRVSLFCK